MDGCENQAKSSSIAEPDGEFAVPGLRLKEAAPVQPAERHVRLAQVPETPTSCPAPALDQKSEPSLSNFNEDCGPDRVSSDFSLGWPDSHPEAMSGNLGWPRTRSRQLFNIAYFGLGAAVIGWLSNLAQGPHILMGLAACIPLILASLFFLVRPRSLVTSIDELPGSARHLLRFAALIFPLAIIGYGVWFLPVELAKELALADRLYRAKDYEGAVLHYNKVVRIDAKNEHSQEQLADSYLRLATTADEKSIASADLALTVNPDNVSASSSKAWALNNLGRYAEALPIATAAAKKDPTYGEAFACIANAQRGLHHYAEALLADNEHVRLHGFEAQSFRYRAETLTALGRTAEANADLSRARKIDAAGKK